MSEKDEQLCEVCGREKLTVGTQNSGRDLCPAEFLSVLRVRIDVGSCYCLGYEREKARADAARMGIGFLLSCIASGEKLSEGEEAEFRALGRAQPPAGPSSDSAQVATLRLDVAWWRARVEAVESKCQERHMEAVANKARAEAAERERDEVADEFRRYKEAARGGFAGIDASARAAQRRAEAAEAAQAKLTEALREARGCLAISGWDGPVIQKVDAALTSAASAPQAPPSDAAEEVK